VNVTSCFATKTCISVCACLFSHENDGTRSDHDGTSRTTTDVTVTVNENGDADTDVDDIDDDDADIAANNSESDGGIVESDEADIGFDEAAHVESSHTVTSKSLETTCSHSSSKLSTPATGPSGTVTIINNNNNNNIHICIAPYGRNFRGLLSD